MRARNKHKDKTGPCSDSDCSLDKKKKKDANTLNDQAKFYILHVAKDSGHIGTVQIREGTEVFFEEKNSFSSIQNTFDDFPCQWP